MLNKIFDILENISAILLVIIIVILSAYGGYYIFSSLFTTADAQWELTDTTFEHYINEGESLQSIAQKYYPELDPRLVGDIIGKHNGIKNNIIFAYSTIEIPHIDIK